MRGLADDERETVLKALNLAPDTAGYVGDPGWHTALRLMARGLLEIHNDGDAYRFAGNARARLALECDTARRALGV